LVNYLATGDPQAQLAAIPDVNGTTPVQCVVESAVPNPRPQRMIAVYTMPTAGPQSIVLSTRRVAFQIYEGSEWVVAQIAETARALVVQSKYQGLGIKRVNVIGEPARFPGPGEPWRWQFTADVMVRAIAGAWS
jgi:hypothetical protein